MNIPYIVVKLHNSTDFGPGKMRQGVAFSKEDRPYEWFPTEKAALSACEELAIKNPLQAYAVMEVTHVKETGKPTILSKIFTKEGELKLV